MFFCTSITFQLCTDKMTDQDNPSNQNSPDSGSDPDDTHADEDEEPLPSGPEGEDDPTFVEIPLSKYKELQEQVKERDEYLEQLQQVTADYDNYQKRMRRKREEEKKYAARDVINSVIPVLNDFKHALPDEVEEENADLVQGMRMIYRKFTTTLEEHGIDVINETGVPFDPNRHEATSSVEDEEVDQQTVVEVLRDGFQLHEQVLQPAQVVIAQPPSDE